MKHEELNLSTSFGRDRQPIKYSQQHTFNCGYCNTKINGYILASHQKKSEEKRTLWIICPSCSCGTVIEGDSQYPIPKICKKLTKLPEPIRHAYDEACDCLSVNAFTACVMMCRKLLMNIAVESCEAKEAENFTECILKIEKSGFINPSMRSWVDQIRKHGNDATHKMPPANLKIATQMILNISVLLESIYVLKAENE